MSRGNWAVAAPRRVAWLEPLYGADHQSVPGVVLRDRSTPVSRCDGQRPPTNPWHSHPCAHGVYVLEGTLKTHQGQYSAGSFVWFPEGGIMEHGAKQDEDCTFLFITNKAFAIHFVGDESDPEAPERVKAVETVEF